MKIVCRLMVFFLQQLYPLFVMDVLFQLILLPY